MAARCGRFLLIVVLSVVALSLQQGCAEKPAPSRAEDLAHADHPPISWQSPRMLDIRKQWELLARTPVDSKNDHEDLRMAMDSLLARQLSDENVRQLVATCDTLPVKGKDRSDFDNAVLQFMVIILVEAGDREHLVKLLATRCPRRIYPALPIELYLPMFGYKLKDPIEVLGEAYSQCKVPEVRHRLAAVVRRGFAGFGIQGTDDAQFVENAMQWYEKEKHHLAVNGSYWEDDLPQPRKPEPLFEVKPGPSDVPAAGDATEGDRRRDESAREQPSTAATNESELARLQGTWEMTSATANGEPVKPERIRGGKIVVAHDVLTKFTPAGEKDLEWRIRLDVPQQPGAMDLVGPGTKYMKEVITPALYELEGDTLRLCRPRRGDLRRPTAVESPPHSSLKVITLKRSNRP